MLRLFSTTNNRIAPKFIHKNARLWKSVHENGNKHAQLPLQLDSTEKSSMKQDVTYFQLVKIYECTICFEYIKPLMSVSRNIFLFDT